jgi:hypothetical protein
MSVFYEEGYRDVLVKLGMNPPPQISGTPAQYAANKARSNIAMRLAGPAPSPDSPDWVPYLNRARENFGVPPVHGKNASFAGAGPTRGMGGRIEQPNPMSSFMDRFKMQQNPNAAAGQGLFSMEAPHRRGF